MCICVCIYECTYIYAAVRRAQKLLFGNVWGGLVPLTSKLRASLISEQTLQVLEQIQTCCTAINCSMADVVFVHLYIADVGLFAEVNAVYCRFFGKNPPSRSCVSIPMDPGMCVMADALIYKDSHMGIQLGRSSKRQVNHISNTDIVM